MNDCEFCCKKCGWHKLEEVMINVTVATTIDDIGPHGDLVYGNSSNEDGEVQNYQCMKCGQAVLNDDDKIITDYEELGEQLLKEVEVQRRDEKNGVYPGKEDIAN